jgi:hypothetical protein
MQYRWVRAGVLVCLCAGTIAMAGCNGGRDSSTDIVRNTQDVVITGFIVDGPVVGTTIDVISNDGATVSQALGGATATFSALVPANTVYPVRLRVSGGTDLVTGRAPDFVLEALISRPDQIVANLSPFSTLVTRISGCADARINQAVYLRIWDQVMSEFGMGYDEARFGHPAWTLMQANNVSAFALASEVLGETVRRTQRALTGTSATIDDDAVITAVACDFARDQVLDGAGDGASARISATFHAAAAGVLMETLTKRLQVGGADAMSRLDESLRQGLPGAGSVFDVEVNPILVRQTRDQLASLLGQIPGDVVARLLRMLDQTSLANLSEVVAAGLTQTDVDAFARVADTVAVADDLAIKTVLDGAIRVANASQPVIALSASPSDVQPGEVARLSWAAAQAQTCWASGAWTGERVLQGTHITSPLTSPARYALTCTGLGGTVSEEVGVAVEGATPAAAPRVDLRAVPSTIEPGASATLAWTSTGATECSAGGDWSGARLPQGSLLVGPLDRIRSYSITCTGPGGSGGDVVGVTVRPTSSVPPPVAVTTSINATPGWIAPGGSTTLSWTTSGATACTASGAWTGSRAPNGSATVASISRDSTFTMSCSGPGGNAVASTAVSTRVARLSWRAADATDPAVTVAGFRLFHGTAPGVYGPPITVSDPAVRQFELELTPGTHYFALAGLLPGGGVGALSNEVSKTVE